ncbi:pheromone-processing carboxypeptidase KEX1-like [Ctenocephalides felis]|uniref:pheromone-processing carboxypeptidase KEX1-like n=1 Tax=Ctenocephalides felis TaxID=7515 RepID=UPI000E6E2C17|nr:pheromone-processing carboxypeptidase KEX1-like [Ctenocephalides felis]
MTKFETFVLPDFPSTLSSIPDRVAVIGVIGKSSQRALPWGDKGAPLSVPPNGSHYPKTPNSQYNITGYYDHDRRAVFLQLCGPMDTSLLLDWLQKRSEDDSKLSSPKKTKNKTTTTSKDIAKHLENKLTKIVSDEKAKSCDDDDNKEQQKSEDDGEKKTEDDDKGDGDDDGDGDESCAGGVFKYR